jgi:hypothetical protein
MHDTDLVLDGNAAAGALSEVFTAEATSALVTCASCGARGAIGTVALYAHAPGMVLRCPTCTGVLLRLAEIRGQIVADFGGVRQLLFVPAD